MFIFYPLKQDDPQYPRKYLHLEYDYYKCFLTLASSEINLAFIKGRGNKGIQVIGKPRASPVEN